MAVDRQVNMTKTLKEIRNKYISFNPKRNVYTFPITGMQEKQLRQLFDDLYSFFDEIDTTNVTFSISNPKPIGYIACYIKQGDYMRKYLEANIEHNTLNMPKETW